MNPFSDKTSEQLAATGERGLIERIRQWLGPVTPPSPVGMGDDCAVLPAAEAPGRLLTTDVITWGRHIDASVPPEAAGGKLLRRNLSDLAAMGGTPGPALLSLLCGPDVSLAWLERFFLGLRADCGRFGVRILGGDVSELAPGNFSAVLTQTGFAARPVLRTGAKAGDRIYVTGTLGGSLLGKHYTFEPRLEEGMWLAARGEVSAMMDLSDGLAKDLSELVPPGCHAALETPQVPLSEAAETAADGSGRTALEHAFRDGEDYELLFTHPAGDAAAGLEAEWAGRFPHLPLTCIGRLAADGKGPVLRDAVAGGSLPWTGGFEHFSPRQHP